MEQDVAKAVVYGGLGAATGIAVFSMIADIAPAQDRARLFGLVAAASGT